MKIFLKLSVIIGLISLFGCNKDTNNNQLNITGTWILIKDVMVGYEVDEGESEDWNETDKDMREIFRFDKKTATWYTKESDCYDVEKDIPYSIAGNRMLGLFWRGKEEDRESTSTWTTTVEMKDNQLILVRTEDENEGDYKLQETSTQYFKRYNGTLPPKDWPQTECK